MNKGLIQTYKVFLHNAGHNEEQLRQIINIFTGINLIAASTFLNECQVGTVEIGWFLTQEKAESYFKALTEAGADVTYVVGVDPGEIYMVEEAMKEDKDPLLLDLEEDDLDLIINDLISGLGDDKES